VTGFDYAFLGLAGLSVLVGVWRGLISEIFALLGWLIALVAAWFGASAAAGFLPIESESLRWLAAFALIFIVVLIVLAMFRMVLKGLLAAAGLSVADRLLGGGFGLVRAVILALLLVLGAGLTSLPREAWWREAVFAPPLETVVIAGKPWLPAVIAKRIKYR
jgi:membrane protein required for colicin V production